MALFCTLGLQILAMPPLLSLTRGDKANPSGPVALPFLLMHNLYWGGGRGEGLSYHSAAYTYRSKAYLSHERLRGAVKQGRVLPDLRLRPSVSGSSRRGGEVGTCDKMPGFI